MDEKADKPGDVAGSGLNAAGWLRVSRVGLRRWGRGMVVAAALLGLIWIAEATLFPWLVGREVGKVLASLGFANASFTVRDVSLTRAVVAQIAGGTPDDPTIDAAVIRYNPLGLLRSRLDDNEMTGARLTIDTDRRRILLGESAVQPSKASSATSASSFPFAQIILRSCSLVLRSSGRDFWVPFSGTIQNQGEGKLKLALAAHTEGAILALGGGFDSNGNTDISLDATKLDLSALRSAASNLIGPNVRMTGFADAQLRYHRLGGASSAHVAVVPQGVTVLAALGSHHLVIHQLAGNLAADFDAKWVLTNLAGQAEIAAAAFDQEALGKTQFSLVSEAAGNSSPSMHLSMQAASVDVPAARLGVHEISIDLGLSLPASGGTLIAGTPASGTLKIGAVDVGGISLHGADASQPIATVLLSMEKLDQGYTLTLDPNSSVTIPAFTFGVATVHLPRVILGGAGHFGGRTPPSAAAMIRFAKASGELQGGAVAVSDVTGDLPVHWNTGPSAPGELKIGGLHVGNLVLPDITATAGVDGSRLGLDAHWPILNSADLTVRAALDLREGRGDILLELPEFKLTDPDAVAAVVPSARGVAITGVFSGKGDIKLDAGHITPSVAFSIRDALLEDKAYDAKLAGLNASVSIESFSPLTTPGNQQLTIKQARIGKLEVANGSASFRVEGGRSILVEKSNWDWEGGSLDTDAFRFDPASPRIAFTVDGNDLNLKSVLATFSPGEATGDGLLYGRLPVTVNWPSISFGKGFLYSAPGPGLVQLQPSMAGKMGDLLDSSDPRFKSDDQFKQVKQRALQALRDFQYDVLKADWQNTPKGVVGTLHLEGKGRQGASGQAMNLNISFQNLDRALTRYLIIRKGAGGSP